MRWCRSCFEAWRSCARPAEVKAAIAEAMPMLTGEFTSRELAVTGGLGPPAA